MLKEIAITELEHLKIGHAQDVKAATGCTVLLSEDGVTAGVDVRGGAPGTRETDLLRPENLVEKIHSVILSGGSAFGLAAASGVMQYLEEQQIGFDVKNTKIPIVCGAVLFDLMIGRADVRPDHAMGYQACVNAGTPHCAEGNVGAGTGATVGKIRGTEYSMKSGLGTYCLQVDALQVGALVAVNCFGDVIEPHTGEILAGALHDDMVSFANTEEVMIQEYANVIKRPTGNTTIGVIVTNANLTKVQANKVASMAQNGYARTIRPAHSMVDGDTIFTLATGQVDADINVVGLLAARTAEQAIVRAVKQTSSLCGLPCHSDVYKSKRC
jgi:L-aminopeptidase/D-esterase-like protein